MTRAIKLFFRPCLNRRGRFLRFSARKTAAPVSTPRQRFLSDLQSAAYFEIQQRGHYSKVGVVGLSAECCFITIVPFFFMRCRIARTFVRHWRAGGNDTMPYTTLVILYGAVDLQPADLRHHGKVNRLWGPTMTDETINYLNDARAMLAAAMALLSRNLTGDHRELPDMIATMLLKAADDLDNAAEAGT